LYRFKTHGFRLLLSLLAPAALLALTRTAESAVTEPNGLQVPATITTPGYNETTLQAYLTSQGETINAVTDASTDPAVFQPLCNFQATLVLSQSQAYGGLAWYNVPADPTSKPTAIYPIIPVTATTGGVVGQVVSSADIVSNPNYQQGFVGFALTKYEGANDTPVYYSEYQRNVDCTGCTTPGYWKMALVYPSSVTPNGYYLAFEDWEGAGTSSWPDDGDFNDKVFKIAGVTCMGGGQPCETSGLGACKPGLTECGLGGAVVCKAQVTASPEKCDNFDNDCNGLVDDGNLCDPGYVCEHGSCVHSCDTGEFPCQGGLACDATGFCIDPSCANIDCDPGKACRSGQCVGACDGVTCPLGQSCDAGSGLCLAACDGVSCPSDQVCENGVCVANCSCRQCPTGDSCNKTSGACVQTGCETVTCAAGTLCSAGKCVDPCAGAVCPGGAACTAGKCGTPLVSSDGSGGADGGMSVASAGSLNFGTGATPAVGDSTAGSGALSSGRPTLGGAAKASGCGCRFGTEPTSRELTPLGLGILALLAARRRRLEASA
jgi:MYXO-CTERM domain-containing protein